MVTLTLDPEELRKPGVAEALAAWCLSLAGGAAPAPEPVARRARVLTREEWRTVGLEAAAGTVPTMGQPRPARARRPQRVGWRSFRASLPERTQRLLSLVRAHRRIAMASAAKAIGVEGAKAIGGVLGTCSRDARKAGLRVPVRTVGGYLVWEGVRS